MVSSVTEGLSLAHPDQNEIKNLFDAITDKYDFLNSFFSFGLDGYWRKKMVAFSLKGLERSILDLGAGTGKSLEAFLEAHQFEQAVGCDFSEPMIEKAKHRIGNRAEFMCCDFHSLPFPHQTFDIVTGSFILRSVQDMSYFLMEIKRVLKPGGKAVFLELTRPGNPLLWACFKPYLKFYIPCVGALFSRHDHAYQFLSESIQAFMTPKELEAKFLEVRFKQVSIKPLTFGAAAIVEGRL